MLLNKILIIGGGISGMSAAIALARAGFATQIVEEDPEWRVLGAGITVLGSTLRALGHLGVLDEVMDQGYFAYGNDVRSYTGALLFRRPGIQMPDADLPSSGGILRPALHNILSAAVRREGVEVRLGLTHRSIDQTPDHVEVGFTDGTSGRYDLVIAAEGLHSATRKKLFPNAPEPAFTGQGCWRLISDRPAEVDHSSFFVGGPVTVGTVPVSQSKMYVWVLETATDNPWIEPAEQPERLRALLASFGGVVGELRDQIGPDSTIVYRPLEALLMPAPWYSGRVLLSGDAAHATTPHLASGAGMGIEDGVVIAQELQRAATIEEALARHMARRFERCRMVVENSLAIGRIEMAKQDQKIDDLMNQSQLALGQPF